MSKGTTPVAVALPLVFAVEEQGQRFGSTSGSLFCPMLWQWGETSVF